MELLYCSRCQRAIQPGGLDEGRYFQLGDKVICPKCYHKAKPDEHSGGTVPVEPVRSEKLLGVGRFSPAESARPHRPPTTKAAAFKPPTSRVMPAVSRPASSVSDRLRAIRENRSGSRMAVPLVVAAVLVAVVIVVFLLWPRDRASNGAAGSGAGGPSGKEPVPEVRNPNPAPNPPAAKPDSDRFKAPGPK